MSLSTRSAKILESPVFGAIQAVSQELQNMGETEGDLQVLMSNDQIFMENLKALLIAYFNLAMSHELAENIDQAKRIYSHGFDLCERFVPIQDLMHKKFKFKVRKFEAQSQPSISGSQSIQPDPYYSLDRSRRGGFNQPEPSPMAQENPENALLRLQIAELQK